MATTKTRDDVINKVAALLGKRIAGEALGAVEYDTIDGCIDPCIEEIAHIVYIGDTDAIPVKYFNTFCRLVANHAASEFSNTPLNLDDVAAHERRLRKLAHSEPSYQPFYGNDY